MIAGHAVSSDLLALFARQLSKGAWVTCDRPRRSRAVEQRVVASSVDAAASVEQVGAAVTARAERCWLIRYVCSTWIGDSAQ